MSHEDLIACIEREFGGLHRSPLEELAADDAYLGQSFINAVRGRTWQELRPLSQYIDDGSEIVLFSPREYQYYLPAYLIALVDESNEFLYLSGVLYSLWYDSGPPSSDLFNPHNGTSETLRQLEMRMPFITHQERKSITEHLPGIVAMHVEMRKKAGAEWVQAPYTRHNWEERMSILTDKQKKCIALLLVQIFARTEDPFDAPMLYDMLDKYWGAFLKPEANTE